MANSRGQQVIALEEHYYDHDLIQTFGERTLGRPGPMMERLLDLGELRIKEMDANGIDIQVLSHGAPSGQRLDPDSAAEMVRGVNDRLAEAVKAHPDRFEGFAALPTPDPAAAADELDRCVSELGFKGAMIHGLTNGAFIDEERFWPIFERAQALDVPIYLHPAPPHPDVVKTYYAPYDEKYPIILGPGWGFTAETAVQGLRLVLSGLFDKVPEVKFILGHLGESLPFMVWRINQSFNRTGEGVPFREIFCHNFYITTSGFFSDPALQCCISEMGIDHVLFSIDWPFVENEPGAEWMEQVHIAEEDRIKILSGNCKALLKM